MKASLDAARLRRLVEAGRGLVEELDPDVVLKRLLQLAQEITGARYAALGVLDERRRELERFLTSGVDEATRQRIGDLPRGRGVLGLLIDHPRPLRLPDVSAHPRSYGFPVGHPPMRRFLGVPVLLRGRAWGNLYLTEKEDGDFTAADEEAAVILAEWAALAVENARLYQAAAARADVLSALRLPADGAPPGAVLRTRRPLRHRGDGRGRAPARLPPRRRARAQPLGPRAARRNPAGARRPARAAVLGLRSGRADALERAVRQPRASGSWPCASGCSSPAAG